MVWPKVALGQNPSCWAPGTSSPVGSEPGVQAFGARVQTTLLALLYSSFFSPPYNTVPKACFHYFCALKRSMAPHHLQGLLQHSLLALSPHHQPHSGLPATLSTHLPSALSSISTMAFLPSSHPSKAISPGSLPVSEKMRD